MSAVPDPRVERHVRAAVDGPVATVTIDRPQTLNALAHDVLDDLAVALDALATADGLHAVVLTGGGDRTFASGGDLVELARLRTREQGRAMALHARGVLDRIRRFPLPVVAALNGDAIGGGAELALACDHRIAGPSARISFAQGRQALTTGWGGGPDLIRLVGPIRAMRLLADTDPVDHDRGLALGLYDAVAAPGGSLADAVDDFLRPVRRQRPQVLRAHKALATAARMGGDRPGLEAVELERFADNWVHQDHWDALEAFLNRARR